MRKTAMAGLVALMAIASLPAGAELYKCVKDGKTAYQEAPCASGGAETRMAMPGGGDQWVGCYEGTFTKMEAGANRSGKGGGTDALEVRKGATGLKLRIIDNGKVRDEEPFDMRPATADELKQVQAVSRGITYTEGLAIVEGRHAEWDGMGLWRGRDDNGRDTLFAMVPLRSARVIKVPCRVR